MDFFHRRIFVLTALVAAAALRAQNPTLTQPIPAQTFSVGGGAVNLDLRNYFGLPGVTGQVVQFDTTLGKFNVELLANDAPLSVQNFLNYVGAGKFSGTLFHRSAALGGGTANRIVQGGGYNASDGNSIKRDDPIALEYKLANARGTLAMARAAATNSGTSEWFFNVDDNTTVLGASNAGGYAVFGRVLGTGMSVVDAISALPVYNLGGDPFTTIPLQNIATGQTSVQPANLILTNSVTTLPIYPASNSSVAALSFAVVNLNSSSVATATLSGATLTITPLTVGTATFSVRAADVNNNSVSGNLTVTVSAAASSAPTISVQPVAQTMLPGSTVAFSVVATGVPTPTYQWIRSSGTPGVGSPVLIAGATSPTLVLSGTTGVNAAIAANYSCVVTNSVSAVTSAPAALTLVSSPDFGHLTNLAIFATLTSAVPDFTVATVIGTGNGTKPLLVRAVGPSLEQLRVPGFVVDTTADLFLGSTLINSNDDWGGTTTLANAFNSVGAFPYASASSKDSALFLPAAQPGSYSMKVSGVRGGTGLILAEIYDGTPGGTFTAATPRLLDVSVLKKIAAGESLTVGFTIGGGTSRTVLVRAAGPALTALGIPSGDVMADPKMDLYLGSGVIGSNDDWGGATQVNATFDSVGAFRFANAASKDAVIIATLAPGNYTAIVTGANGSSGLAVVEVYDVP